MSCNKHSIRKIISILHLSDTLNQHRRLTQLPDAGILMHSGGYALDWSGHEAIGVVNWLCGFPCHHKIFLCGNYDACLHGAKTGGAAGVRCLCVCGGRSACGGEGRLGLPGLRGSCACVKKNRRVRRCVQVAGGQRVAKRAGWRGGTGRLWLPGGLFRLAVQPMLRCGVGVAVAA